MISKRLVAGLTGLLVLTSISAASAQDPRRDRTLPAVKAISIRGAFSPKTRFGPETRRAGLASSHAEFRRRFWDGDPYVPNMPVFYSNGERAVFVAPGEGRFAVRILSLLQQGATLHVSVEKRELKPGSMARPYHVVKIWGDDLPQPVTGVRVHVQRTVHYSTTIPIRGQVAKDRFKGPATRKAGLASLPAGYRSMFDPQGEWKVDAPVRYADGERVVFVSMGEGDADLRITGLRQRGRTLVASVEKTLLPKGTMARGYHAVLIRAADLEGPVDKVSVRVTRTVRTADPALGGDKRGMGGVLSGS